MWPFKRKTESPSQEAGQDSMVEQYRFCATLQLRTPLAVLEMHGMAIQADGPAPVVEPLWHGIWVPVLKSWRELGIPIDEMPPSTMSSDMGPVPADGGEYLGFLLRFRRIIECTPEETWSSGIEVLLKSNSRYRAFCALHGGADAMVRKAT